MSILCVESTRKAKNSFLCGNHEALKDSQYQCFLSDKYPLSFVGEGKDEGFTFYAIRQCDFYPNL